MGWRIALLFFLFFCVFTFDVSVCGHAVAEQLHVSVNWLHQDSQRPHTYIMSLSLFPHSCPSLSQNKRTKLNQSDMKTEEPADVTELSSTTSHKML